LYILNTPEDVSAMLASIGVASIEALFDSIPETLRLRRPLAIPPALSEIELTSHLSRLAGKNQSAGDGVCFLGGGAYDHFIPAIVDAVASRSEYYTAYTPYQAEASQGSLQAFFEFQTLICQLTGMDIANASLYEGGSSVAEAVIMAIASQERRGNVLIAESVHPEYRQVLATYLTNLHCNLVTIPTPEGFLNPVDLKKAITNDTICVALQNPNFFGALEEVEAVTKIAHSHGAWSILSFDPISLGLMKGPGAYGVDVAVAEGQGLGTPLGFGGPYLGLMACKQEYVRKIPGRIVGETIDRRGKRCWVLTLQTREQHIRRDKATSNICTNQGLFALRAAVYLASLGPQGLRETAELCLRKSHYLAAELQKLPGVKLKFNRPFFKEFSVQLPTEVESKVKSLLPHGYHAGLPLGRWYPQHADSLLVAVTEKRTQAEMDRLVALLK
jgi:glycine dehydrogenase subunit 1